MMHDFGPLDPERPRFSRQAGVTRKPARGKWTTSSPSSGASRRISPHGGTEAGNQTGWTGHGGPEVGLDADSVGAGARSW
jgi:hypothetical protein